MNLDLDSPPRNNENKDEDFDFEWVTFFCCK
jgi:hypothetical protein